MVNRLLKLFTAETYWKERLLGILAFAVYGIGNLIEQFSGKVTSDPPVIWITGIVISVSLIWISLSKYRRYTSYLFKLLILFGNFNMVFAYGESTKGSVESESLYLLFSYAIFIVSSQVLDSRRELILMTLFETMYFAIAVYINRGENPLLLSPFQLLMFLFVMGGNFLIGLQRLRLTQVTGGSTIQFRMLSENARDVQSIINPQFNFMYVNPSVKQLSGFGLNDLNGKNFLTLVVDQDKAQVQQVLTQLSENPDKKQNVEYRIKGKDSTEVWVESIFSLFKPDPNLPAEFIFSETRDIEARKKLEEEIQKQLRVEEMLIKFSNRFINMERMEIQQGINVALGEFGKMLQSDGVLIYRTQEQPQGEFRSTNQWFAEGNEVLNEIFNLSVHINQPLIIFLRSMGGTKSSHGDYVEAAKLNEIGITTLNKFSQKTFYIIPLQSGNVVNGFVVFVFDQNTGHAQSSFFGLIGNMIANAFTRLSTEIRLHEAQLSNEFILRALPDWLYIINKNGNFTGSNNYSTLPAYLPNYDLVGKSFRQVMPENISLLFTDTLKAVIDSDLSASFEYQDVAIYQGRYFKVIIAPFKANEYLVIIRDITDLRTAQSELENKALKLEMSNKELEEFAYIVSHDMKQPIRTIISYLTLLKRKHSSSFNEEANEFLKFSIDGANKMSDLIRDILQYSKLEQQLSFVTEVSLQSIVTKVLAGLQEHIAANNATVTCDSLPNVRGNETMLTELFQNLIENGIKYNTNKQRTIIIHSSDEDTHWKFSVTDNGIGFEQQYAEQIFKIFKRLHNDDEFQGTGIGLSICQKVVEKHGGKIWATSEKGKGSTFHFILPK